MICRGEIWWAQLPDPVGSQPAYRRPVIVISSDDFNRSAIGTVAAVIVTSNLRLAAAPGNVVLSSRETGLPRKSTANVSQVITVDRRFLIERCGRLSVTKMRAVDDGLRLALAL